MNDIDITLFLNEYRVKALEEALGNRTAETIEDKLSEAFDVLYQEYVDDEQRASIEAKIECEEAAEQARIEAKRRFAVYHVRENGEDYHFTSDHFRSPMQAAYDLALRWLTASAEHGNQYAAQLLHSIKNNRNWFAAMGTLTLLHHISRMIRNRLEDERKGKSGAIIDRKLRRKIQEKNEALGIKQG